jgi:G patch domain-containing protein 1
VVLFETQNIFQVRDEKGRRRLHGAFTGGFSAGYFNTVGSKEGTSFGKNYNAAFHLSVYSRMDTVNIHILPV